MKETDLMFCCLGNGVTVCDRNCMENGDYKTVAHIEPCGVYKPYCILSEEDKMRIRSVAASEGKKFSKIWTMFPNSHRVDELVDYCLRGEQFDKLGGFSGLYNMTQEEQLKLLRKYTCINDGYIMP